MPPNRNLFTDLYWFT